jgi:hypothetical protein
MNIDNITCMSTETLVNSFTNTIMTGEESYPIIGGWSAQGMVERSFKLFADGGLFLEASCWEKACMVKKEFFLGTKDMKIVGGRIRVLSADLKSAFGYDWNPPTEVHIWLEWGKDLIDLALPGVIIRGMNTYDNIGPILTGRNPVVLVGTCPDWIIYEKAVVFC